MLTAFKLPRRSLSLVSILALMLLVVPLACGPQDTAEEPAPSTGDRGSAQRDKPREEITSSRSSSGERSTPGPTSQQDDRQSAGSSQSERSISLPTSPGQVTLPPTSPPDRAQTVPTPDGPPAMPIPTRVAPAATAATWVLQEDYPLHRAAFEGSRQDVEELIDQGEPIDARVEMKSSNGASIRVTPLELAVWNNELEVVELLQEHEAKGSYLVSLAAHHNPDPEVMEVVLGMDPRVGKRNRVHDGSVRFQLCPVVGLGRYPESVARFLDSNPESIKWSGDTCDDGYDRPFLNRSPYRLASANPESAVTRLIEALKAGAGAIHLAAAINPEPAVIEVLLDYGADLNVGTKKLGQFAHGRVTSLTPLYFAARYNPEPAVAALLIDRGARVNPKGHHYAYMPLYNALLYNPEPSVAALLIARGANIDREGSVEPFLHVALKSDHNKAALVSILLEAGANIEERGLYSRTPLLHAAGLTISREHVDEQQARQERREVVAVLLEHGAKVNARDESRRTALHLALRQKGGVELVEMLLEHGADVNVRPPPLHEAVSRYRDTPELVRLLLDKGADVNATDSEGRTALHRGVYWGVELVRLLLDKGADVNATDSEGRTPLYHSLRSDSDSIGLDTAELLLARGADPNAVATDGKTPCRFAQRSTNPGFKQLFEPLCPP